MKLIDLNPRWVTPDVFCFDCPHCQKVILTCKRIVMSTKEQMDMWARFFGEFNGLVIVPCGPNMKWNFISDFKDITAFNNMTVTPSLDASASSHWHGFITNGEIR